MFRYAKEIAEIRARQGMDQSQFAAAVGVKQSTISRWESGKQKPSVECWEKIVAMGANQAGRLSESKTKLDGLFWRDVSVVGAVEAGEWREALEWPDDEMYVISVPRDARFPDVRRFGLVVRGPSMNLLYPEGTLLVCAKFIDLDMEPDSGVKVVAIRRDRHGLIEATVKEYLIDSDGSAWLWPRSNHPEHQSPRKAPHISELNQDDEFIIWARVLHSIRQE